MRTILALAAALFAMSALAENPALHGTWSAANFQGQPVLVEFAAGGTGSVNGAPMKWSTLGGALFVQQGGQVANYGFKIQGDKLLIYPSGSLQATTFAKGSEAYDAAIKAKPAVAPAKAGAPSSGGQELVGKWCDMHTMMNNQGGSSRMACFELRARRHLHLQRRVEPQRQHEHHVRRHRLAVRRLRALELRRGAPHRALAQRQGLELPA